MYGQEKTKILHLESFQVISMQIGCLRKHLAREGFGDPPSPTRVTTYILDPMQNRVKVKVLYPKYITYFRSLIDYVSNQVYVLILKASVTNQQVCKYRTRAIKGRALYLRIIFWALRLSHKKQMKIGFQHDFLGGRLLIESDR